ncbi:membrane protein BRI3-like [Ruditapes philippinarum]|uniref:membrane protein BRI3-like n=1 Tax=Ruditapes philippinarum TaxID=129788 RepID=UPI00295AD4A4|nr:membrane protein BRI3-like [Ruditapes philippinarum]
MSSYPPPPPQYQPQPNQVNPQAYPPPYGQPQIQQQSNVVVISQPGVPRGTGNCPHCGIGFVKTNYTLLGFLILLIFFPIGIICCLLMTEKRCSHCGAKY